jgi:U32 family peptidase
VQGKGGSLKNSELKRPELLSPAGDFEKLRTAIHYGADAVYLGDPRFSLRNKAKNFEPEELAAAVRYAHERNVKVYITVNVFARNSDLSEVREHITFLREIRPDAVIISDPGVFMLFREKGPEIDIHVSTQANITNIEAALFWQKMGAKRLILSRELSIDEIREINEGTDIELEAFVHGSICLSYSGKCYLSSFMASRSANSGECTNSCRWKYALVEEKRRGEYYPVFEDERGTYVMNSRDLCLIEHLQLLRDSGINSFKIEGRMKGIHYAAGVTRTYREAVDLIDENEKYQSHLPGWHRELSLFDNRGYTSGLLFGKSEGLYNFSGNSRSPEAEVVGVVVDVDGSFAKVALRRKLSIGDALEYMTPGLEGKIFMVESLRYEDGIEAVSAQHAETVLLKAPECPRNGLRKGDLIRKVRQA